MTNSTKTDEEKLKGCVAGLIALLFVFPLSAFQGWALSVLWRWFVVPATQWNEIGVWHGAGITALVTLVAYTPDRDDTKDPFEKTINKIYEGFLIPSVCLGFGWLYHLWMVG